MQTALFIPFRHHHVFALITNLTQRVFAGVIHGRRVGERRRVEVLHLIQTESTLLQPQRQIHHVFITGAGVCGDEVWDQILLFPRLF